MGFTMFQSISHYMVVIYVCAYTWLAICDGLQVIYVLHFRHLVALSYIRFCIYWCKVCTPSFSLLSGQSPIH